MVSGIGAGEGGGGGAAAAIGTVEVREWFVRLEGKEYLRFYPFLPALLLLIYIRK